MSVFPDIYRMMEKLDPEWFDDRRAECPPPDQRRRILLVEDAVFFRQLVKGYLESDGYEVVTAVNGRQGLERLGEGSFDLVVSDIEMPVMNGWDFVKAIKADKSFASIPVIALTALDAEKDVNRAQSCGFDKYQVKIDREALLKTVADSLRRSGGQKEPGRSQRHG